MKLNARQNGYALVVGLIVLLVMTLIVLVALRTTAMEARMAGNLRNYNVAFQAAESALREAEQYMETEFRNVRGNAAAQSFSWIKENDPDTKKWYVTDTPDGPKPRILFEDLPASTGIDGLYGEPTVTIELMPTLAPEDVIRATDEEIRFLTFRITADARGEDGNARVRLQSTFKSREGLTFKYVDKG